MSAPFEQFHPMGEHAHSEEKGLIEQTIIDTYGGRIHVEWDNSATVTPLGQLPFFIEFLKTSQLFDELVSECPLSFSSNNASRVRDILGSLLLSILSGHTRYSHVSALRGEGVNAELLGMKKIVSEDVVRRALLAIDQEAGVAWLENNLKKCYTPLLNLPWILDLDATVKPLYGNQEGAEVGYNPTKPGRPSHVYHSYFIGNIRMALNVDVQAGTQIAGCYSKEPLFNLLSRLPQNQWPQFIRGDISYGNENFMRTCEEKNLRYLFKLKSTPKVKAMIKYQMEQSSTWRYAGHGYEGVESEICLEGWSKSRRIIILRRRIANQDVGLLKKQKKTAPSQQQLALFEFAQVDNDTVAYEYAVLITNLTDEIITIAQHYRDRGDSENNFDELKNQWGWCGFTTQDLKRCQLTAKFIALVYDWWTIFVRLVDPGCHREAITSRPLLMNAVGKLTHHSRQKRLTITSTHTEIKKVSKILTNIAQFFKNLQACAEQLSPAALLKQIIEVAFRKFFGKVGDLKLNLLPDSG